LKYNYKIFKGVFFDRPAGETVSNTFTLNYEVNDTPQPPINNDDTPTEFAVDRLVNVTVSNPGDTFVVADQISIQRRQQQRLISSSMTRVLIRIMTGY